MLTDWDIHWLTLIKWRLDMEILYAGGAVPKSSGAVVVVALQNMECH